MTDDYPLLRWVRNACCLVFASILALVLFYAPHASYVFKQQAVVERGPVLFGFALLLGFLVIVGFCLFQRSSFAHKSVNRKAFFIYAAVSTVLLVFFQLTIVYGINFQTGWDVQWLTTFPPEHPAFVEYLSRYPNQVLLYAVLTVLMRIGSLLGLSGYLFLEIASALCVSLSLLLMAYAIRSLFGPRIAISVHFVSALFIGLSPWIVVPYSDTFGMLMPAATLWAYCCIKNKYLRYLLVPTFSFVGYLIKPTSIFILIGICAVEVYRLVKARKPFAVSSFLRFFACVLCAVLLVQLVGYGAKRIAPDLDESRAFSMTHFLMMGANEASGGGYSQSDVDFSDSAPDTDTRSARNIEIFADRVSSRSISENVQFGLSKLMSSFSDGRFAWGFEGGFFLRQYGNIPSMESFYGVFPSSEHDGAFYSVLCQIFWLFTLSGLALGFVSRDVNKGEVAAYSALIMLAVFLVIFECRARYLLLYMPFFVAFGFVGWVKAGRVVYRRFASHQ